MKEFNEHTFLTEIIEELREMENVEVDVVLRARFANILGRLGTFNWIKYGGSNHEKTNNKEEVQ